MFDATRRRPQFRATSRAARSVVYLWPPPSLLVLPCDTVNPLPCVLGSSEVHENPAAALWPTASTVLNKSLLAPPCMQSATRAAPPPGPRRRRRVRHACPMGAPAHAARRGPPPTHGRTRGRGRKKSGSASSSGHWLWGSPAELGVPSPYTEPLWLVWGGRENVS